MLGVVMLIVAAPELGPVVSTMVNNSMLFEASFNPSSIYTNKTRSI